MRLGSRSVRMAAPHACQRAGCDGRIRTRLIAGCANVYVSHRWNRLEWWHQDCYNKAGSPHGTPTLHRTNLGTGISIRTCACGTQFAGPPMSRRCPDCVAQAGAA